MYLRRGSQPRRSSADAGITRLTAPRRAARGAHKRIAPSSVHYPKPSVAEGRPETAGAHAPQPRRLSRRLHPVGDGKPRRRTTEDQAGQGKTRAIMPRPSLHSRSRRLVCHHLRDEGDGRACAVCGRVRSCSFSGGPPQRMVLGRCTMMALSFMRSSCCSPGSRQPVIPASALSYVVGTSARSTYCENK